MVDAKLKVLTVLLTSLLTWSAQAATCYQSDHSAGEAMPSVKQPARLTLYWSEDPKTHSRLLLHNGSHIRLISILGCTSKKAPFRCYLEQDSHHVVVTIESHRREATLMSTKALDALLDDGGEYFLSGTGDKTHFALDLKEISKAECDTLFPEAAPVRVFSKRSDRETL